MSSELADKTGQAKRGRSAGAGHESHAHRPSRELWLAPVLNPQSCNPGKMRGVSCDEHAPLFKGRSRDQQICVSLRKAALAGRDPEIRGSVKYGIGNRQDERVLAERGELLQLLCRTLVL